MSSIQILMREDCRKPYRLAGPEAPLIERSLVHSIGSAQCNAGDAMLQDSRSAVESFGVLHPAAHFALLAIYECCANYEAVRHARHPGTDQPATPLLKPSLHPSSMTIDSLTFAELIAETRS